MGILESRRPVVGSFSQSVHPAERRFGVQAGPLQLEAPDPPCELTPGKALLDRTKPATSRRHVRAGWRFPQGAGDAVTLFTARELAKRQPTAIDLRKSNSSGRVRRKIRNRGRKMGSSFDLPR